MNLLWQMVRAEIRLRDQGTLLGFLWTLLNPLLLFGVLYVVFQRWFAATVPHYALFLALGIVFWNFFSNSTSTAVRVLEHKRGLFQTQKFPRVFVPWTGVLAIFSSFVIELLLVVGLAAWLTGVTAQAIVALTVGALSVLGLSLGFSLLLSRAYVAFRDVEHAWSVILRVGFFATPVFYPLAMIDGPYAQILRANPLTHILTVARAAFETPGQPWPWVSFAGLLALGGGVFLIGCAAFKASEERIVEAL